MLSKRCYNPMAAARYQVANIQHLDHIGSAHPGVADLSYGGLRTVSCGDKFMDFDIVGWPFVLFWKIHSSPSLSDNFQMHEHGDEHGKIMQNPPPS